MKDRIRKIMESQHMTQQVFASFIGVSPGTLSSIFTGRTNPTLNIVESIKSKIPSLSTDWLMFGKGQMYLDISASEDGANGPKLSEDGQPMLDFSGANNSAPISGSSSTPQNEGGLFQGKLLRFASSMMTKLGKLLCLRSRWSDGDFLLLG